MAKTSAPHILPTEPPPPPPPTARHVFLILGITVTAVFTLALLGAWVVGWIP